LVSVAGKKTFIKFEGALEILNKNLQGYVCNREGINFDFTKVATNNAADFMVFIFDNGIAEMEVPIQLIILMMLNKRQFLLCHLLIIWFLLKR
jgi:hypothetical protein